MAVANLLVKLAVEGNTADDLKAKLGSRLGQPLGDATAPLAALPARLRAGGRRGRRGDAQKLRPEAGDRHVPRRRAPSSPRAASKALGKPALEPTALALLTKQYDAANQGTRVDQGRLDPADTVAALREGREVGPSC